MKNTLPPTGRSLPIALIRARETVMAPIRAMLAESGITEQQWRILRVLSEAGPLDSATLATRAALLPPSVTRIVQSMTARDLLRQTSHPTDRRKQVLSITPEGQSIIDTNLAQAIKIAESYKKRLGAERYETLLDLLEKLADMPSPE